MRLFSRKELNHSLLLQLWIPSIFQMIPVEKVHWWWFLSCYCLIQDTENWTHSFIMIRVSLQHLPDYVLQSGRGQRSALVVLQPCGLTGNKQLCLPAGPQRRNFLWNRLFFQPDLHKLVISLWQITNIRHRTQSTFLHI